MLFNSMKLRLNGWATMSAIPIAAMGLSSHVIAASGAGLGGAPIAVDKSEQMPVSELVDGEVIVKFVNVPTAHMLDEVQQHLPAISNWREIPHAPHYKGQPGVPHPLAYYRVAEFAPALDPVRVGKQVSALPAVEHVEPNGIVRPAWVPSDTLYDQQYGPQIIGMEQAWEITRGDPNVVIAIGDSGINFDHLDLLYNIWTNDDPPNRTDDDGNGFVDDTNGWNFYGTGNTPIDDTGHGSHVSGIAAAGLNNRRGIAGLARVKIMPIKVIRYLGSWEDIAAGTFYAVDNNADVLNLSLGGYQPAQIMHDAVMYAWEHNMPVIAAAGNDDTDVPLYPAAYPEVIAVGATDRDDNRAQLSNHGDWLDVMAPGIEILSCYIPDEEYVELDGTSMSAPHVTGLVGLMYSINRNLLSRKVLIELRDNVVDLGDPGFDPWFGYGRIDAVATLNAITPEECLLLSVTGFVANATATWTVESVTPGRRVAIVYGFAEGSTEIDGYGGYCASFGIKGVNNSRLLGQPTADSSGVATLSLHIPPGTEGITVYMQAAEKGTCHVQCMSNLLMKVIGTRG